MYGMWWAMGRYGLLVCHEMKCNLCGGFCPADYFRNQPTDHVGPYRMLKLVVRFDIALTWPSNADSRKYGLI